MPELPEVETIRRQLAVKIVGKKLDGLPAGRQGKKIVGLRRRAKILIIDFSDGSSLIFHLKLTGQLILNGSIGKHTRHIFRLSDGSKLIFNDARKFGWWKIVKSTRAIEESFGPEATEVGLAEFRDLLRRHPRSKIKQLLMNQKVIAGIGNIYSDEILFSAKVSPLRPAGAIKDKEIGLIHRSMKKILSEAIKYKGSSVESYLDAQGRKGGYLEYHKVYQRDGRPCPRCKTVIKRQKLGGRSAHFCPNCQK